MAARCLQWARWKLLQSQWWLEVMVTGSLLLHLSPLLATDAHTGLKWKNVKMRACQGHKWEFLAMLLAVCQYCSSCAKAQVFFLFLSSGWMGMDRLMVVIPDLVLDDYKIWYIVNMTIWQFIHFDAHSVRWSHADGWLVKGPVVKLPVLKDIPAKWIDPDSRLINALYEFFLSKRAIIKGDGVT